MNNYEWYPVDPIADLRELLRRSAEKYGSRDAFQMKDETETVIKKSFVCLQNDVDALGSALCHMGLGGMHIALLGENSYEWLIGYLAVANGTGVIVPIDKDLMGEEIANILRFSDVDAVICSGEYLSVINAAEKELGRVFPCVVMGKISGATGKEILLGELLRQGYELLEQGYTGFTQAPIDPASMQIIINTSGTTGHSKAVMLSHKNIVSTVLGGAQAVRPLKKAISVLPAHHTYECTCCLLTAIYTGLTVCFIDSLKYLQKNFALYRPDTLVLVPLFIETMYKKIMDSIRKRGKEKLFYRLVKISNRLLSFGIDVRRLFFHSVIKPFGGRLRLMMSGGAPLRPEFVAAFRDIGIQILNGYGITECSPLVSVNRNRFFSDDSVGVVIPCCQVRISAPDDNGDGEVLVKGPNVMLGYYKNPQETEKVFEDGWFKTGDVGRFDEKGLLLITGRKKNTIILSNGKNVQPEELEQVIVSKIPYVKDVVVYAALDANQNEMITAIAVPDGDYLQENGIEDVEERLRMDIRQLNRTLPTFKQIGNVRIKHEDFEKTSTKKIKRFKILQEERSYAGTV